MAEKNVKIIITAVDKSTKTLRSIGKNANQTRKDLTKLGALGAAALAGIGVAATALGKEVVRAAGEFEQMEKTLGVLIGSQEEAAVVFDELRETARQTPFDLAGVIRSFNQLIAVGSPVEEAKEELEILGNVAAGVNVPLERVILNFGQVRAQGKLTGRELRDFAVAGIPLLAQLADQLGVTTEEILKMTSAGEIGFDEVKEAFTAMTSEGGKFHNLMQIQSETTLGKFQNLEDSVFELKAAIGESLAPQVKAFTEDLIVLIDKLAKFVENNPTLVKALFAFAAALGVVGVSLLVVIGSMKILGLIALAFGVPMLAAAGAIGLVILAVTALILAFTVLRTNWELLITNITELWKNFWFNMASMAEQGKNKIVGFFKAIAEAISNAINKFKEFTGIGVEGGLGIPSFQHGGTVPGSFNQAVPTILHGGERVISRTGTDVNTGGGGGGMTINLTIEGDVNSMQMIDEIIEAIKDASGRETELSEQGVAI